MGVRPCEVILRTQIMQPAAEKRRQTKADTTGQLTMPGPSNTAWPAPPPSSPAWLENTPSQQTSQTPQCISPLFSLPAVRKADGQVRGFPALKVFYCNLVRVFVVPVDLRDVHQVQFTSGRLAAFEVCAARPVRQPPSTPPVPPLAPACAEDVRGVVSRNRRYVAILGTREQSGPAARWELLALRLDPRREALDVLDDLLVWVLPRLRDYLLGPCALHWAASSAGRRECCSVAVRAAATNLGS
eukprot:CAMPEP_0175182786 /NCGR_PEP_ID=MMETSP0093-20121207/508_1 /TAXON_ID=311494 /ORGANISM="Alexandrium monilatum, Strain CCMP3105" /LENGTH=242 /DNA_ID=CAMNT_0016475393 /DNA_START=30 /DNA_END=754 /DNA_ORIENTATION=-